MPSLLEVSSGRRLHKLSRNELTTDDRALPLSSTTAHAREATVAAVAVECNAAHVAAVKRTYANVNVHKIERVPSKPFHTALDRTNAAHQLVRSIKLALADILVRCDDKCFDGLEAIAWVAGWELPLRKCIQKAITTDKPSTFDLTNTFDDSFRQGKQGFQNGASGLDTFKMLLRLVSALFDEDDGSASIAKLHSVGIATKTPLADYFPAFRLLIASVTDSERVLALSVEVVLLNRVVRNSVSEQSPGLMPVLYPGEITTA